MGAHDRGDGAGVEGPAVDDLRHRERRVDGD
nr:MAG TPA: hypothetical protein [Caudoviricetes sp.]